MSRVLIAAALTVAWCGSSAWAQAGIPVDVASDDPAPSIEVVVRDSNQICVAWRTTEGRLQVTGFRRAPSGERWQTQDTWNLTLDLPLLGGLTLDEAQQPYVAAFQDVGRDRSPWKGDYDAGSAKLYRLNWTDTALTLQTATNLNTRSFSHRPLTSALRRRGEGASNSQLLHNRGKFVLAFGHDDVQAPDRTVGALMAIQANGAPVYQQGGSGLSSGFRLVRDGDGFVVAQVLPEGIGLSKLRSEANTLRWTGHVLVQDVDVARGQRLQIAGIVPTPRGYLLITSSDQLAVASVPVNSVSARLVSRNFESLPRYKPGQPVVQGNFDPLYINVGGHYPRSFVVPLSHGRSMVVAEHWAIVAGDIEPTFQQTIVSLIDENGTVLANKGLRHRIQRSATGFLMTNPDRVGWVNGENGELKLHLLDEHLNVTTESLDLSPLRNETTIAQLKASSPPRGKSIPATSTDITPGMAAAATRDDEVQLAWRSREGTLTFSQYRSDGTPQRQIDLGSDMPLLGGLANDPQGTCYLTTFREENATAEDWARGHRPEIGKLWKIPPGSDQPQLLVDFNRPEYTPLPIINPVRMTRMETTNSQMVWNRGKLALAFGHNNGQFSDIHSTGTLVGFNSDGTPFYHGGGAQHPGQVCLAADGDGFVLAQIFDQGIGLSTLKTSGPKAVWSDFVLVYEIPRANPAEELLQIAGILPTDRGYHVVFASGQGWLWSHRGGNELGKNGACEIKSMFVSRNFETLPKFDWWANVRRAQGNFPLTTLHRPTGNESFLRPVMIPFQDGAIIACEQWASVPMNQRKDPLEEREATGTWALKMSKDGAITNRKYHPGIRVQRSASGFVLPKSQRAAWINGEGSGQLVMHAVDQQLNLTSTTLGQPAASTPVRTPAVTPTPPTNPPATAAEVPKVSTPKTVAPNPPPVNTAAASRRPRPQVPASIIGAATNPASGSTPTAGTPNGIAPKKDVLPGLVGRYQRLPVENDWHDVHITRVAGKENVFLWTNQAGVSWQLTAEAGRTILNTDESNPYYSDGESSRRVTLEFAKRPDGQPATTITGVRFLEGFYTRVGDIQKP